MSADSDGQRTNTYKHSRANLPLYPTEYGLMTSVSSKTSQVGLLKSEHEDTLKEVARLHSHEEPLNRLQY